MIKNRLFYLIALVISVYLAILYDGYVSVLFTGILFLVPIAGGICIPFWKRGIKAEIYCADDVVTMGEEALVTVVIKNKSIFPVTKGHFFFEYEHQLDEARKQKISLAVDGRNSQMVELKLDCMHCGSVALQCQTMCVYDYFGLYKAKIPVRAEKEFLVIPAYEPLEEALEYDNILISGDPVADSLGEYSSEIKDLREYRPGDPVKRIHWKISSKKKKWMLKEYCEEEQEKERVFFAFLYQQEKPDFEWYDEKMDELVNTSMSLLMEHRVHDVVWYHPHGGYFHRTTIENPSQLWELVAQVIRAGIDRMPEGFETQLHSYLKETEKL